MNAREAGVAQGYRIIGAEESPYSVKVRSYLRYKKLPHQWLSRTDAPELYQQHARLPLVPLVVTPDGQGLQDSTPIIEHIEATHQEPSIHPPDPVARFVSILLEEFGDEWGNKWMFHYRWARPADQLACSRRLAEIMSPDSDPAALEQAAAAIRERMVNRIWFVGSSPATAQQIEDSFKDTLAFLEPHLATRDYLFGGRPAFADFALWGQLYNANRDPTPHGIISVQAPNTSAWIERMQNPEATGEFETWQSLEHTLKPLLTDQVGGLFLPWSQANARAITDEADTFTVQLRSGHWQQKPQKYHARSLESLRAKYRQHADNSALRDLLADCGALAALE